MRRGRSRTFRIVLVPLLAAAGVVVPAATPASTQPLAASTLTKSVRTASSPAAHGATASWTLSYDNNSPAVGAATITDPITAGHTYVPGSLKAPQGWTPQWSTNGTAFQDTEPASGTVAVRAANPVARPDGTALASELTPPVQAAATATGGDGFTPLLHRTATGSLQAWNIFHHAATTQPKVVCSEPATGALCAGGPWPKTLNTAVGPLQGGSAGDIASPLEPQYVRDPGNSALVYYAAVTETSVGVGCLDLENAANCGYWPLLASGGSPVAVNNLAGLVEVAGNLYGVATTGAVTCWTMSSKTACPGQPFAPIVPPNGSNPGLPASLYLGAMTVVSGKVFASSSPQAGLAPELGCFDPATGSACSGWASSRPVGPANNYTYNAYTAYNTAGAPVGACASTTGGTNVTTCFTTAGGALASPPSMTGLAGGVLVFNPEVVVGLDGHTRGYFGIWGGPYAGATICHDWTTGAGCAGFPNPASHPTVNGGATRDYGYAYDSTTQCLIGLGDAGVLFSLDPATGASPCVRSGAAVTLTPSSYYCDGGTGHVTGYLSAKLAGITPANVDFAASSVTVVNQNGTTVPTPGFAPDGSVDLTGVSASTHTSLTVTARLVLTSGADFGGGARPNLVVDFAGDDPQVCFQTTLATTCTVTDVANTANGTDGAGAFTSNAVSVPIAPGPACQPVVRVDKEICASHTPSHCGPGGVGPWVKQTPVGLLGALFGTARWRITITNDGPVPIDNATVYDAQEPSCETAGGTFSLAPGQSKQVYCSTYAVLTLFPVENYAKAQYTPRNSPPGTQPTYSPYSSAKACALLCNL
ncbi:hypothetical protein BN6_40390 [Saccharothrix espanaensis DSM 44229]|uniref:DUF7617 domain-containing protein n=1 Tax=Saccharothrix espanaensis (strain ATCC 51144 / DSM 44229 / JCM 9112 / NBRC 15066 / NRRL 15764) TaxID=1179773 RepID=K0JU30_SACES|nr:hypothetical protein BN6_40390 [Saccharothrix espanaensis DSM 44229]